MKTDLEKIRRQLRKMAFGKPNDCVKLAMCEDVDIEKLDLSMLTEIKRSEKGTVEIKLLDRTKVLEQLAALAEENDIVELRLLHGSRTVTAGSSSDYTPQKGFFDKRYYVGSKEMETIDDFRRALEPYAPGGTVTVLTIDGVKPQ